MVVQVGKKDYWKEGIWTDILCLKMLTFWKYHCVHFKY